MSQLTFIQGGEFIVCDEVSYQPPSSAGDTASLQARTILPINTMHPISVRLENEIIPLPFLRSRERRVVTRLVRLEGTVAARIADALGLAPATSTAKAP